jgi:hypothetical protein
VMQSIPYAADVSVISKTLDHATGE